MCIRDRSIPLASAEDKKVSEIMRRSLDRILTRAPNDEFIEEALEEMDLELEEFETSIAPTDKKKLH